MSRRRASSTATTPIGEVLLIGCEGAGKTLLCRHLTKMSTGDTSALKAVTQPSIGVEIADLAHGKHSFTMREVGGIMQPVWPEYYEACAAVVLMADGATTMGAAMATVELRDILSAPTLAEKRVLLLLNKQDLSSALPEPSVGLLMGLPAIEAAAGDRLRVLRVSALHGAGLAEVLEWCVQSCIAHRELSARADAKDTRLDVSKRSKRRWGILRAAVALSNAQKEKP
uniref:ADP-ribosylation factor-like protein 16 n=1 Tax=Haptolina brevifila TaxID=156173 RepID=A0A7S2N4B1_9EUKA|mmetsp:Transcript_65927/g.130756  ORF Transcript_65927/g.130756 Transcript_65927/m.130756 type:complete len:227 (+) Transcript_65927:43-723(+)|eukprot:CAMPEP_0174725942 /NCGR_PEP_ID=MMETSP1094-20130205/46729_1 /TAXON_ID=156173 /ORGANISM="Chrysochromulina brevifilum, Strain UTEX LB 985" /LENGTH=226 /DNA_ID=CAMNT_0015927435 /DNA_START=32 /DNA_END=712 /DNA_ORIENTATION=+